MNQGTYMNENFSIKNKYENVHYLRSTTGSSLSTNMSPRSLSSLTATTVDSATSGSNKVNKKPFPMEIVNGLLGRESTAYGEQWLHAWQRQWLSVLQLLGDAPRVTKAVAITGPKPAKSTQNRDEETTVTDSTTTSNNGATSGSATLSSTSNASLSQIDGKLFAMFRILYAKREAELLQHGYNPFLLQSPSSVLSLDNEKEVIKSILGIISIVLFQYETELHADLEILWKNDRHHITSAHMKTSKGGGSGSRGMYRDTITEVQTFLRNLLYSNTSESSSSDVMSNEQLMQRHIQKVRVNAGKIIDEFELNLMNEVSNVNTPSPTSTATDDDGDDGENRFNSNISGRGDSSAVTSASSEKLTHNMQAILKYRIRKKSILMDLVYTLISHYERLVAASATDSSGVNVAAAQSLLPYEDRGDRKAKIKDLLNEVSV